MDRFKTLPSLTEFTQRLLTLLPPQKNGVEEHGRYALLVIHHGATRDDLRRLFAHSTPAVTDRYVHDRGTHLEKIANVLRLFPAGSDHKMTITG